METWARGVTFAPIAAAIALFLCTDTAMSQGLGGAGERRSPPAGMRDEDCSKACRERFKRLERQVRSLQREVRYLQEEVTDLRQAQLEDAALAEVSATEQQLVCDPPYVVDDGGIKRFRFECLQHAGATVASEPDCDTPYYFRKDGVKLMKVECL